MLIDVAISGDRNVIKKEVEEILKLQRPHKRNSALVECESKSDTGNNMGDWNRFKITQTVPERHKGEARN
jgi:hypothetical protein